MRLAIVVRLRGGLGNQMFQYAAGRHVADESGAVLYLDTGGLDQEKGQYRHSRQYFLDWFSIRAKRVALNPKTLESLGHGDLVPPPATVGLPPLHYLPEDRSRPSAALPPSKRSLYLDGFWQSEEFFSGSGARVRADLMLRERTRWDATYRWGIGKGCTVAVHIRRGDYLSMPEKFPPLGSDYYERAMALFDEDARFLIFGETIGALGEDRRWWLDSLGDRDARFVETGSPAGDLELMSRCTHNIIANSSFSWWAAYRNRNPAKRVVAPVQWFGPALAHLDISRLVPKSWIRV